MQVLILYVFSLVQLPYFLDLTLTVTVLSSIRVNCFSLHSIGLRSIKNKELCRISMGIIYHIINGAVSLIITPLSNSKYLNLLVMKDY